MSTATKKKVLAGVITAFGALSMAYTTGVLGAISLLTFCALWYYTGVAVQAEKHVKDLKDLRDMVRGFRQ